jgi:hypothetical protein
MGKAKGIRAAVEAELGVQVDVSRGEHRVRGQSGSGSCTSRWTARCRPASWNTGCGPGPTPSRTSGTPPWPPSTWRARAAARPPPRLPRRSPRPDAGAEHPGQPNQGMTRTRRLATMTPRTPGRTAGLDNRWTTRSPLISHIDEITTNVGVRSGVRRFTKLGPDPGSGPYFVMASAGGRFGELEGRRVYCVKLEDSW